MAAETSRGRPPVTSTGGLSGTARRGQPERYGCATLVAVLIAARPVDAGRLQANLFSALAIEATMSRDRWSATSGPASLERGTPACIRASRAGRRVFRHVIAAAPRTVCAMGLAVGS